MTEAILSVDLCNVPKLRSGKVRDLFDLGDSLLMVATDRISAFDVIMGNGIPDKGKILTHLSAFWFDHLAGVVPNHILATDLSSFPEPVRTDPNAPLLEGRTMWVKKTEVVEVECVVRGYLAGSGWREYQETGSICGAPLPSGLADGARLPEPIFTPATKAQSGHDENIPEEDVRRLIGDERTDFLVETSKELYRRAGVYAEERGLIIADTKFEFGVSAADGEEILLIDEILTPDSSRFWDAAEWRPGHPPVNFDKQFVRDYLESIHFDKQPPGPILPDHIVEQTRERYLNALVRLTGKGL